MFKKFIIAFGVLESTEVIVQNLVKKDMFKASLIQDIVFLNKGGLIMPKESDPNFFIAYLEELIKEINPKKMDDKYEGGDKSSNRFEH